MDTAEFDYFVGGTFTKPGFLTPDTDLVAVVSAERTIYPTYTETSAAGRLGLTHFFSDEITFEGGMSFKRARFDDGFGTRDFSTLGLYAGATYDGRDSSVNPTEGFYASGMLEPFYDLRFGRAGARITIEGRTYFGFSEDDAFILAGRIKGGALVGPDLSEIPPDKLFFAGGGGSVRGYGFKSIGVDNGAGVVTGGRYLLEGSLEARAKVTEDIGIVGFVDGGYVAADTFPGLDDLRLNRQKTLGRVMAHQHAFRTYSQSRSAGGVPVELAEKVARELEAGRARIDLHAHRSRLLMHPRRGD